MGPQKFSSVRHKARPAGVRPFRDDSLVAFRYEQTIQLEPPIPIPPRNPLRNTRPFSTISGCSTIVVSPPPVISPHEQHPALRNYLVPLRSPAELANRDSVFAPTASSTTIREEGDDNPTYHKADEDSDSSYSADVSSPSSAASPVAPSNARCVTPPSAATTTTTTSTGIRPCTPSSPTSLSPPSPISRKLVKSFSFRSGTSMNRLRKKSLCEDAGRELGGLRRAGSSTAVALSRGAGSKSPPAAGADGAPHPPNTNKRAASSSPATSRASATDSDFEPLAIPIPTAGFLDDDFLSQLSFSKRGSIMLGGKRAFPGLGFDFTLMDQPNLDGAAESVPAAHSADASATDATTTKPGEAAAAPSLLSTPSIRIMSADVERESQKVRSLYESGEALGWEEGGRPTATIAPSSPPVEQLPAAEEVPSSVEGDGNDASPSSSQPPALMETTSAATTASTTTTPPPSSDHLSPASASTAAKSSSSSPSHPPRPPGSSADPQHTYERAGGIEDWEDVDGRDIDRYGFIADRSASSRPGSRASVATSADGTVSTPKKRKNVLLKRDFQLSPSLLLSVIGGGGSSSRSPSRKVSARSLNTQASEMSTASRRSTARSSIRTATNLLPHNRERRWMDEAGDMLTLPPGLADIEEEDRAEKLSEAVKRREWERAEKWRKMARAVVAKKGTSGEGATVFEFDTHHPKLIDRTWKGIPDRWRASAWSSFLAASVREGQQAAGNGRDKAGSDAPMATDEELVAEFARLQGVASPDDVQIDLDVPRTINRHIMFRRRYRGGQRLLFRVLHAVSLYFPETGYVQGMASIAATLLSYYDEEHAFVMLVRMWQLRGLERLYQPGFEGLISALGDFERIWLRGKDVSARLTELGIDATAYGTRWYLTLFNLSIPFPAQLRVWDVFMLLGDNIPTQPPEPEKDAPTAPVVGDPPSQSSGATGSSSPGADATAGPVTTTNSGSGGSNAGLDVLHATSAALFHALNEVLVDSDFENAMKALTSWIPIKDEDMLMKVARAEWKLHGGKKKEHHRA